MEAERRRRATDAGETQGTAVTLESLFGEIHKGNVQDFNLVLKADVQGSVDPLVRDARGPQRGRGQRQA